MNKIFVDDKREPLDARDWWVVRSYDEFVTLVMNQTTPIDYISFDHDLGEGFDGYDCVKFLCKTDADRHGKLLSENFDFHIHSQNPVGAKNMINYLSFYLDYKESFKVDPYN